MVFWCWWRNISVFLNSVLHEESEWLGFGKSLVQGASNYGSDLELWVVANSTLGWFINCFSELTGGR